MSKKQKKQRHRDKYNGVAQNTLSHREHFTSAGYVKKSYSRVNAEIKAADKRHSWPGIQAYQCGVCNFWHLGNEKSAPRYIK